MLRRIIAGVAGAGIAGLFLITGLLSQFALETSLAFIGALVGVLLSGASTPPRSLTQIVGAAIVGVFAAFILYTQIGTMPRSLPWLFGFGLSSGLIYGLSLGFIARAVRGSLANTDRSKTIPSQE